jgi:hypothetical protein
MKRKKNRKKNLGTQKVWNFKWVIWLTCLILFLLSVVITYLMFVHFYAQQPEFLYKTEPEQICHYYNGIIHCYEKIPDIKMYNNNSKLVVEQYSCWAVKVLTLKEPFVQNDDFNYDGLEYE